MSESSVKRNEIRAQILGNTPKGETRLVTLFGAEIELHQPTLRSILEAKDDDDEATRTADVFIKYAYVPGTKERVFEAGDRDSILNWPMNDELLKVQRLIVEMTGIDLADATEEIQTVPLAESS
ncbi:MAG: hypothetical protein V3S69_06900 [Dehalococcoidales bacterium]